MFAIVTWTADPILFSLGSFDLRWYALMFIVGFLLGSKIMERIYRREGLDPERVYRLFLWCFVGTIVGARLGHCLFYDPGYYLSHPLEILMTWKGGLASHGGTIGVITCVWLYARRDRLPLLWVLDRLSIAVAPVAALIRLGNLFNHEIYGHPTAVPWAFRFVHHRYLGWLHAGRPLPDEAFTPPCHPTQLYEALAYVGVFLLTAFLYRRTSAGQRRGLIFGTFLMGIFGARFLIEYVKEVQEAFEEGMIAAIGLNQGQLLSLPFIAIGAVLVVRALRQPLPPRRA